MVGSSLYAAFLDLEGRPVLLVGGGAVAARKAHMLLESGADVTVISPEVNNAMGELERTGAISRKERPYRSGDLAGNWLVIAATDDKELNQKVFRDAEEAEIFCNVVDCPSLCSFQVPATVQRGHLQLAISTRGSSPLLARKLREQLEDTYGPEYAPFLQGLRELRDAVQETYPLDEDVRRAALQKFMNSDVPALILDKKDRDAFKKGLKEWMKENLG